MNENCHQLIEQLNELVAVNAVSGKPVLCRHKTQGGGKVGLAHAGRSEEDHVFSVFQKAHGGQFIDLALINRPVRKPGQWEGNVIK